MNGQHIRAQEAGIVEDDRGVEGDALSPLLQQAYNAGVCPNYSKSLLKSLNKDQGAYKGEGVLIEPLSAREVEILQLVDEGLRNKEIAERLSISLSTVKAHIYNVFSKLQSSSRTEAVSLARNLGIL